MKNSVRNLGGIGGGRARGGDLIKYFDQRIIQSARTNTEKWTIQHWNTLAELWNSGNKLMKVWNQKPASSFPAILLHFIRFIFLTRNQFFKLIFRSKNYSLWNLQPNYLPLSLHSENQIMENDFFLVFWCSSSPSCQDFPKTVWASPARCHPSLLVTTFLAPQANPRYIPSRGGEQEQFVFF